MYEINVLVNGTRCKKYYHEGKTFIEAKRGSEYSIEIKNNTWNRILAVCSVDGLDIISGKPAVENSPGYVIGSHSNCKFDGFRVNDEKVAKFVFDYKDNSYAASKQDGSEKNTGVIGVRIFNEKIKQAPIATYKTISINTPTFDMNDIQIGCDDFVKYGSTYTTYSTKTSNGTFYSSNANEYESKEMKCCCNMAHDDSKITRGIVKPAGFDMGTSWGESKKSKVVEVEFETENLAVAMDIYYASRKSLIEMGVISEQVKQVNFPQSFKDSKYAVPPKGWIG